MANLSLRDIMQLIGNSTPSGPTPFGQLATNELKLIANKGNTPYGQMGLNEMAMGASPTLSLPAAEGMRNYADGEMPLYTGGLLQNPQGQMVDPQQLLNVAYDMSAPREMRIDAINRLRAMGAI